ncbi:hypothetical protein [Parvibaculum sp.]|uniref:hypothetical protein n=1 Tax=Parvibaculum sp. TaxID=2024848 RepID=UPI003BAA92E0
MAPQPCRPLACIIISSRSRALRVVLVGLTYHQHRHCRHHTRWLIPATEYWKRQLQACEVAVQTEVSSRDVPEKRDFEFQRFKIASLEVLVHEYEGLLEQAAKDLAAAPQRRCFPQ